MKFLFILYTANYIYIYIKSGTYMELYATFYVTRTYNVYITYFMDFASEQNLISPK